MTTDIDQDLYLIGIRVEPDIFDAQLYTIYVGDERPILLDGCPIFFTKPEAAERALLKSNCGAARLGPAPTELYYVYDLTDAIYTLYTQDNAPGARLVDFINALLDLCNCMPVTVPVVYRNNLSLLADHLTFNVEFGRFLIEHELSRDALVEAIHWCVGMVACEMRIVW